MQSLYTREQLARNVDHSNYYLFRQGFSVEETVRIRHLWQNEAQSGTAGGKVDSTYRSSKITWVKNTLQNRWIFDKVACLVREANKECFGFELMGFGEDAQIGKYEPGDHYDWHLDVGKSSTWRKLSVSVQLTPPDQYTGGDLELHYGRVPTRVSRGLGDVVIFPSFLLHRITPVLSGQRQSLVLWVSGVPYR